MNASDFLYEKYGIAVTEHNKLPVVIKPMDLLKYMEEYAALRQPPVSGSKSAVEILAENDVYVEHSLCGRYWCYKYQPNEKKIVICSNEDKEVAAKKMINELGSLGIYFC